MVDIISDIHKRCRKALLIGYEVSIKSSAASFDSCQWVSLAANPPILFPIAL
jgi:hypothetical protein